MLSPMEIHKFQRLVQEGKNCKEISKEMGIKWNFGNKIKEVFGDYPSVYIYKVKNGKTTNYNPS